MTYESKVIADSISLSGVRLTTLQITFPRIVLAEFNTHRMFCLAGDSELEFDLPGGTTNSDRRVHRMRLDEFVDKWHHGARRVGANPKRCVNTNWVNPNQLYKASEVAAGLGMANYGPVNQACRSGSLRGKKLSGSREWHILGADVISWRKTNPEHTRFDMRDRLQRMQIRQLNENTGEIQNSTVVNAMRSGVKEVFEVTAGDFKVCGSKDHRVMSDRGWLPISELKLGDSLVVRKFGKRDEDKEDQNRLRKIGGRWRSVWQRDQRTLMQQENPKCRACGIADGVDVHHLVPVHKDLSKAFDPTNITLVCKQCHDDSHVEQGWQGGTYLYGALSIITEIKSRGQQQTYDLEIAGEFPNFLANGVVVHNSRNSASSRAIPVSKNIERVRNSPFVPAAFCANQKGMQAGEELAWSAQVDAGEAWDRARLNAIAAAETLAEIGVHKQWVNRLLEPFSWHTAIVTATEWDNFFALRCNPEAQPEIRTIAEAMRESMFYSVPKSLGKNDWHTPYVDLEAEPELLRLAYAHETILAPIYVSIGRCARVSYLTQEGKRDPQADFSLTERLRSSGHLSPFEHVATPGDDDRTFYGNFRGWKQYRKTMPGEACFTPKREY